MKYSINGQISTAKDDDSSAAPISTTGYSSTSSSASTITSTITTIDIDRKSLELTAVGSEGNIGGTPDYCLQNNGLQQ